VKRGKATISAAAEADYLADVALAARFSELLGRAQAAEQAYRQAQAERAPGSEQYRLARSLDVALTDVTRAAYAAQRAEIGPRGYEDRIYHRKAKATPGNTPADRLPRPSRSCRAGGSRRPCSRGRARLMPKAGYVCPRQV